MTHHDTHSSLPLIRWAGSKKKLVPTLQARVPTSYERYIEPFAGSACLFFALAPKKAVIADMNPALIDAYQTITQHPLRVLRLAKSFRRTPLEYYGIRKALRETKGPIRRAAEFLYLNRLCFNGIYRTNKSGHFNVPIGTRTGEFPNETDFKAAATLLKHAVLVCADFESTLGRARAGDFVYLDPPYATASRIDRTEYGPNSFGVKDIPRLVASLQRLHQNGVRFLLSYSECPDLQDLLTRNVSRRVRVRRQVAATPTKRKTVYELLIDNADLFGAYP